MVGTAWSGRSRRFTVGDIYEINRRQEEFEKGFGEAIVFVQLKNS
jgi:hypothetical protein